MKIKVTCDGPRHAQEPQHMKDLGVWIDVHSFRRDLHAKGFIYELTPVCPLECNEMYLKVEVVS